MREAFVKQLLKLEHSILYREYVKRISLSLLIIFSRLTTLSTGQTRIMK